MLRLLLLLLCFLPSLARAEEPLATPDLACACVSGKAEAFEEPIRFAFGKFAGQCVDSCRFRRGRVIRADAQEIEVANVLHLGKYLRARFPLDQLLRAEVGFERFALGVDHVLLRFSFAVDVPLFAPEGRLPVAKVRSIVLSSEGVPPKGQRYSLWDGFQGSYLLDHRVVTGDELDRWIRKNGHPLRLFSLELSSAQAAEVLARGLGRSEAESFRSAYRLFGNNCSTNAIALLDAETGYGVRGWYPLSWDKLEQGLPIAGPLGAWHTLRYRGILSPLPAQAKAEGQASKSAEF